jgi:hypothetical protein
VGEVEKTSLRIEINRSETYKTGKSKVDRPDVRLGLYNLENTLNKKSATFFSKIEIGK